LIPTKIFQQEILQYFYFVSVTQILRPGKPGGAILSFVVLLPKQLWVWFIRSGRVFLCLV